MATVPEGATAPVTASDRELVDRLLGGDDAAFVEAVERHHGRLVRFARLFVNTAALADQVVRDTWLAAVAGLPSFDERQAFKPWIYGILARRALNGSRLQLEEEPAIDLGRFTSAGTWSSPPGPWHESASGSSWLQREGPGVVERAVAGLPVAQRAVVALRDVEGLRAADVCNVLQISETTQRALLHRARSNVRAALEGACR